MQKTRGTIQTSGQDLESKKKYLDISLAVSLHGLFDKNLAVIFVKPQDRNENELVKEVVIEEGEVVESVEIEIEFYH